MRVTTAILVLVGLCLQKTPDDRLKSLIQETGSDFTCERVLPNLYLATDLAPGPDQELRKAFRELAGAIGDQAFPPTFRIPLTVIAFIDADSLAAYARRHPDGELRPPGSFDPVRRRLLGVVPLVTAYAPTLLSGLLLKDFLKSESPPAWLVSGLSLLAESVDSPSDSRVALLKNEWLREPSPTLATLLGMKLEAFQAEDRQSLHLSLSREWLRYLSKRGTLKTFMTELKKSFAVDPTGVKALESVLGKSLDKVEPEWQAYVRSLTWKDPERLQKKAKELFGDHAVVRFDDELLVAVAGNADEKTVARFLEEARKIRRPLLKSLGMKPSYLPLTAYFFKDGSAFQEHVRATSPDRKDVSLGGLYMPSQRTLLVDAGTSPASFVHELAHSWVIDEVGDLPSWLGEGLASLYESAEVGPSGLHGIPGRTLQTIVQAQKDGKIPRANEFFDPRWKGFWESDRIHLSYAMCRALMLYLDNAGRLPELVKNLKMLVRTAPQLDPSCTRTLEKSAGMKLEELYAKFLAWVAQTDQKR